MSLTADALSLPLASDKRSQLDALVQGLGPMELMWLSGYAGGLAAAAARSGLAAVAPVATLTPAAALAAPAAASSPPVPVTTLVYGTASGNSRGLAEKLKADLEARQQPVRIFRASDYPLRALPDERLLVLVISTQGDGDPPDDARSLWDHLLGRRAPRLPELRYAVLGLGDSSYPKFCEVGRILDDRLAALGASRLLERADCDVDFAEVAGTWLRAASAALAAFSLPASSATPGGAGLPAPSEGPSQRPVVVPHAASTAPTREAPAPATLLVNQRITARQADKDVRHLELACAAVSYAPGDALGVWPENPPFLVDLVLGATALDGDEEVARDGERAPLRDWLLRRLEITRTHRPFLLAHAARAGRSEEDARGWTGAQVIDVLTAARATWSARELVEALPRLTPRMYSIASSALRSPGEVHLTVALVDAGLDSARRVGACSHHLATRREDDTLRVFVEPNPNFRLPSDATDIIMVGPGTGVAPFRAFLQEREERGATGRNWLFFGERRLSTSFLYQTEWLDARKRGTLHRLDVAFSRDQAHKIYVQDRMREAGRDLWGALSGGAHLYVCGDARHMAKDVEQALLDVARQHGHLSPEGAEDWLVDLRAARRYARDVY